jgi:hypothetical protein
MLVYNLQLEDDKSLNRSDIVRIIVNKLLAMSADNDEIHVTDVM